ARDRAEEARAIALAMRETLEQPDRTAALVTPDRGLARRVAAELGRWRIAVDDSAGLPVLETLPARFVRLLLETAQSDFAPIPLLGLLKHPLFRVWTDLPKQWKAISTLERRGLRGARPIGGAAGIKAKLVELDEESAPWIEQAVALLEVLMEALR